MKKEEVVARLEAYEEAVDLLKLHIRHVLKKNKVLPPEELSTRVTGRVKTVASLLRKIKKIEREKKIPMRRFGDVERNVWDIAGVRVVCNYLDEIFVIYGYLDRHPAFRIIPKGVENYVKDPKEGYRGLHIPIRILTNYGNLKCELQVRTSLQDSWATKNHSLLYKLNAVKRKKIPTFLEKLMITLSNHIHTLDEEFVAVSRGIEESLAKLSSSRT